MSRRRAMAGTAGLLLVGAIAWAIGAFGEDSQLVQVRELRSQLTAPAAQALSPELRREKWQELQTAMAQLPPEKQEVARAEMRDEFANRMRERMDQFFSLPDAQRREWLDREIKQMEERRKEFAARSENRSRDANQDGSRGPGRSGNWSSLSTEERNRLRKERLDHTTPKERAQWVEYRQQMRERREQLGLPPLRFPSRGA